MYNKKPAPKASQVELSRTESILLRRRAFELWNVRQNIKQLVASAPSERRDLLALGALEAEEAEITDGILIHLELMVATMGAKKS